MVEENETVGTDIGKLIDVVGAAIVRDGKVLCARRGNGKSLAGYWEFPGGKVRPGESRREALRREIEEELLCEVTIADEVCTSIQRPSLDWAPADVEAVQLISTMNFDRKQAT